MTASIYSIPIESTAGVARHYFISSDGTFKKSIGWGSQGIEYQGKGAELTVEEEQRACEYLDKFGQYNIHTNNCEIFAWYVITGKRYSGQIKEKLHTAIGSKIVSLVQPVLTAREIVNYQYEQARVSRFNEDLEKAKLARLKLDQAMGDDFWKKRDAIVNHQYEQAIVSRFNEDLEKAKLARLKLEQAMGDDFWKKRDAIVNHQYEQAIVSRFNEDLEKAKLARLKLDQAMGDDFGKKRDAKEN